MKRYLTGVVAVIIAAGAFAFTKAEIKAIPLVTKIFQYQAPALNPYSQSNVVNSSNWVETSLSSTTCNENNDHACQLEVDNSFINPDKTLKSSFLIDASKASSGNYYVSGGSASAIYNRN